MIQARDQRKKRGDGLDLSEADQVAEVDGEDEASRDSAQGRTSSAQLAGDRTRGDEEEKELEDPEAIDSDMTHDDIVARNEDNVF